MADVENARGDTEGGQRDQATVNILVSAKNGSHRKVLSDLT